MASGNIGADIAATAHLMLMLVLIGACPQSSQGEARFCIASQAMPEQVG